MDFSHVIREMNRETVEQAVAAVFERLEAEGWRPAQAPEEEETSSESEEP